MAHEAPHAEQRPGDDGHLQLFGDALEAPRDFGDLLFAVSNLARKLQLDPETALRDANAKFERRFRGVEARLTREGGSVQEADLETMEALWLAVKTEERS